MLSKVISYLTKICLMFCRVVKTIHYTTIVVLLGHNWFGCFCWILLSLVSLCCSHQPCLLLGGASMGSPISSPDVWVPNSCPVGFGCFLRVYAKLCNRLLDSDNCEHSLTPPCQIISLYCHLDNFFGGGNLH